MKIFAQNKKARFLYEILDTFEAGIMLNGGEVKSIRSNKISINETYVRIKNGEMWLIGSHVPVPSYIPFFARFEEKRDRKLLMHKREITRLKSKSDEKRLTLIITKIYQPEDSGKIKCEIALAKGKNTVDKKQDLIAKDIKREMDRDIKNVRL
jgi:SsrA-binding protein